MFLHIFNKEKKHPPRLIKVTEQTRILTAMNNYKINGSAKYFNSVIIHAYVIPNLFAIIFVLPIFAVYPHRCCPYSVLCPLVSMMVKFCLNIAVK